MVLLVFLLLNVPLSCAQPGLCLKGGGLNQNSVFFCSKMEAYLMGGVLSKLVPLMCNADRGLETESPAIGQFLEKIIV